MSKGFRALGLGFWGLGFRGWGFGKFRVKGFEGFWVLRGWCLGFRV